MSIWIAIIVLAVLAIWGLAIIVSIAWGISARRKGVI